MVDALVSGASVERRAGSTPVLGTPNRKQLIFNCLRFLLSSCINIGITIQFLNIYIFMKSIITISLSLLITAILSSCNSGAKSKEEHQQYVDSLFNVIGSSPKIVDVTYSLSDQLEACDLLIKEYPNRKDEFEKIKTTIQTQIDERANEDSYIGE